MKDTMVDQVNLSTVDGDIGILARHVPIIVQLKAGLVEILDGPASNPTSPRKHFFGSF